MPINKKIQKWLTRKIRQMTNDENNKFKNMSCCCTKFRLNSLICVSIPDHCLLLPNNRCKVFAVALRLPSASWLRVSSGDANCRQCTHYLVATRDVTLQTILASVIAGHRQKSLQSPVQASSQHIRPWPPVSLFFVYLSLVTFSHFYDTYINILFVVIYVIVCKPNVKVPPAHYHYIVILDTSKHIYYIFISLYVTFLHTNDITTEEIKSELEAQKLRLPIW